MRLPLWTVPLLVVALAVAGLTFARMFSIPTVERTFIEASRVPERVAVATFVIPGVRCADTARTAGANLEDEPGVVKFVAFASHNRVEITYNPLVTGPHSLIEAIEGPVFDEESGEFRFGVFVVSEQLNQ